MCLSLFTRRVMTKEKSMATCKVIHCENTDLVYSGTDALSLGGIPTETYCRPCAIAYTIITQDMKALHG
jgi:hypothetical protein